MIAAELTAGKLMGNYGPRSVVFVRGSGAELWDNQNVRYLDFLSGIAVTSLGHAHPAVTSAIRAQAGKLTHVSNLFANEHTDAVVETLDRLLRFNPAGSGGAGVAEDGKGQPGRILFQNSGTETIEAAIKLVRKYQGSGRHIIVSTHGSFHGAHPGSVGGHRAAEKAEAFPADAGWFPPCRFQRH